MDKEKMKEYESPSTKKTIVEMEDGICAASATVMNPDEKNGKIQDHEVNKDFEYDFNESGWDKQN